MPRTPARTSTCSAPSPPLDHTAQAAGAAPPDDGGQGQRGRRPGTERQPQVLFARSQCRQLLAKHPPQLRLHCTHVAMVPPVTSPGIWIRWWQTCTPVMPTPPMPAHDRLCSRTRAAAVSCAQCCCQHSKGTRQARTATQGLPSGSARSRVSRSTDLLGEKRSTKRPRQAQRLLRSRGCRADLPPNMRTGHPLPQIDEPLLDVVCLILCQSPLPHT
eukprot:SAG25_NODE_637_length_6267_cov_3.303988_2_plen_216_part_00